MGPGFTYAPVQDVVAFAERVMRLFGEALPDPTDRSLFERLMYQARSRGLSWIEGLEYVVKQRRALGC